MTDGNNPINPTTVYTDVQLPLTGAVIRQEENFTGLTIFEYFSLEAMKSLISKPEVSLYQSNKVLEEKFERICSLSVIAAKKLIEALNKQP